MVQGPKGELEFPIPELVEVKQVCAALSECGQTRVHCEQHSGCLRLFCGRICSASNVQRGERATKSAVWRVAAQLEDGTLRVFKKVDTRRADELHGLTRYPACARDRPSLHRCP